MKAVSIRPRVLHPKTTRSFRNSEYAARRRRTYTLRECGTSRNSRNNGRCVCDEGEVKKPGVLSSSPRFWHTAAAERLLAPAPRPHIYCVPRRPSTQMGRVREEGVPRRRAQSWRARKSAKRME